MERTIIFLVGLLCAIAGAYKLGRGDGYEKGLKDGGEGIIIKSDRLQDKPKPDSVNKTNETI